ncbi:MAG: hypothetical protein AAFZ65_20590, partial [Planctomycetota bacterium]
MPLAALPLRAWFAAVASLLLPTEDETIEDFSPGDRKDGRTVALGSPLQPSSVVRMEVLAEGPGQVLAIPDVASLRVTRGGDLKLLVTLPSGRPVSRTFEIAPPGESTALALFFESDDFERVALVTDRGEWAQVKDIGQHSIETLVLGASEDAEAWTGSLRGLSIRRGIASTERLLAELAPPPPPIPRRP